MEEETKSSDVKNKLVIGVSLLITLLCIFLVGEHLTGLMIFQGNDNSTIENQSNNTSCTSVELFNTLENMHGSFSESDEWETRVQVSSNDDLSFSLARSAPDELELILIGPTKSYTRTRQNELKDGVKVPAEHGEWWVKVLRTEKRSEFTSFELKVESYEVKCV